MPSRLNVTRPDSGRALCRASTPMTAPRRTASPREAVTSHDGSTLPDPLSALSPAYPERRDMLPADEPRPVDLGSDADRFRSDPYGLFAELYKDGPAHFVRLPNGETSWLIVGHSEVYRALNDPSLSKSRPRAEGSPGPRGNMLMTDPPDHTRLRRLVSRQFTARRVERLRPEVRRATDELLSRVEHRGRMDVIQDFALPLSLDVITGLLGVPFLDRDALRAWTDDIIIPKGPERSRQVYQEMTTYIDRLIEAKRRQLGEDLLSSLIRAADDENGRLDHQELHSTFFLILVAGHETTTNLIANGVYALLTHPDQLKLLRADWDLIGRTVEEVLRWEGSLTFATSRYPTSPYRVGDVEIPADGSRILLALGSAGRNTAVDADADRFVIDRPGRTHLAFGHGIHHCLGAPLGLLEGGTALQSLLTRFPDLTLDTDTVEWRASMVSRSLERLPVRWSPPSAP